MRGTKKASKTNIMKQLNHIRKVDQTKRDVNLRRARACGVSPSRFARLLKDIAMCDQKEARLVHRRLQWLQQNATWDELRGIYFAINSLASMVRRNQGRVRRLASLTRA